MARFCSVVIGLGLLILFCFASAAASNVDTGFIVVSPNQRHFVNNATGATWVPIGLNVAWPSGDPASYYERLFARLGEANATFARIWLGPSVLSSFNELSLLRSGLKAYDSRAVSAVDSIVASAERHGIRLMLTLDSFNGLCPSSVSKNCAWDQSVWNRRNGGPLHSPVDFWSNADATSAWQNMAEFAVDRWGRSPAVAYIEQFNEVDMADDLGLAPHSRQWQIAAATRMRQLAAFQTRPLCQSFALAKGDSVLDSNSAFDFTTSHVYQRGGSDRGDVASSTTSYCAAKVLSASPVPTNSRNP
jgi:hypothetical protein